MGQVTTVSGDTPLWRKIVDFPLVAMLIAVALVYVGLSLGYGLAVATPSLPSFTFEMKFELITVPILILLYELVIRRLGQFPRDDYRDPRAVRRFLIGGAAGFLVFSLAVAIAAAMGVYWITGEGDASALLKAFVTSALFPAVTEELIFRGILFRWIEAFGGSWAALLLTSALFGAAHLHNPDASAVAAVGIAFEAGVMLGAAYMLTRSLWLPMGLHAAWNFTQGEIYDIPVSGTPVHGLLIARLSGPPLLTGNGFGLEASLIAILVATLFGLWLLWLAIRKGELMKPWWVRRRIARSAASK